jgi:NAD-dependent SIR2 family protein deacetylase
MVILVTITKCMRCGEKFDSSEVNYVKEENELVLCDRCREAFKPVQAKLDKITDRYMREFIKGER